MVTIENDFLLVNIQSIGAELTRIYHKQNDIDYLWNGNPEYWGKHAPVLFPIVGTLKENTYYFEEKPYSLLRHGFARDKQFELIQQHQYAATFELRSSKDTLANYPFPFILRIHYSLDEQRLNNRYEVINTGEKPMYYSIGGHPAFHVPLQAGLSYNDYLLEFSEPETLSSWPLHDNLISTHPQPLLNNEKSIQLSQELFANDALVLKHPRSQFVSLKSKSGKHGLEMKIAGFPYLGIWAAPGAPFVCIEPWEGVADSMYHNQHLTEKEGILTLPSQQTWTKSWEVRFW